MINSDILERANVLLDLGKRSEKTKRVYLLYTNKYLAFLEKNNKKIEESDSNDILKFMQSYTHSSAITINTVKVVLSFLYIRVLRNKKIIEEAKETLLPVKIPKREVIHLPHETAMKLINSIPMPYHLIFKTQYICGLRIDEISKLKIKEVLNKRLIGKGNKERTIFLPYDLKKELLTFAKNRKDYIFSFSSRTLQTKFKEYVIKNGLDPTIYKPHSLRKSFTTNMLSNGYSLNQVMKWLGHENINTTQKYWGEEEEKNNKGLYF